MWRWQKACNGQGIDLATGTRAPGPGRGSNFLTRWIDGQQICIKLHSSRIFSRCKRDFRVTLTNMLRLRASAPRLLLLKERVSRSSSTQSQHIEINPPPPRKKSHQPSVTYPNRLNPSGVSEVPSSAFSMPLLRRLHLRPLRRPQLVRHSP